MSTTVRKTTPLSVTKAAMPRSFTFDISDGSVDRDNDTINPHGWDLSDFLRNPVVLWQHDHDTPAIAKATDVGVRGDTLYATATFPPVGIHPLADQIHDLIAEGFIGSTSVGFLPIEYTRDAVRNGVNYLRQSLLEFSIVNVGSNRNALLTSRGLADTRAIRKWLGNAEEVVLRLLPDATSDRAVLLLRDADEGEAELHAVMREYREQHRLRIDRGDFEAAVVGAFKECVRELVSPDAMREIVRDAVRREFGRRRGNVDFI